MTWWWQQQKSQKLTKPSINELKLLYIHVEMEYLLYHELTQTFTEQYYLWMLTSTNKSGVCEHALVALLIVSSSTHTFYINSYIHTRANQLLEVNRMVSAKSPRHRNDLQLLCDHR